MNLRINGGLHGQPDRMERIRRALVAVGQTVGAA